MAQQGGFSAPGRAAKKEKFARFNREGDIPQRVIGLFRVGKAYILEGIEFHVLSSRILITTGVMHRAKYTR